MDHVIDKESLKIEMLEQVLVEKVCQLFRNLLQARSAALREPRRHMILRNERGDAWAGTDHREAVAVNQDFRDKRPCVVGA